MSRGHGHLNLGDQDVPHDQRVRVLLTGTLSLFAAVGNRERRTRHLTRTTALAAACLFLFACGDHAGDGNDPCSRYNGLATREQIARSPLPDAEAEVLAIELSDGLVAPPDVYQRIVNDLAAIRSTNSQLVNLHATPSWSPDDILVEFDRQGAAAVTASTYSDWNCANDLHGVSSPPKLFQGPTGRFFVDLQFAHRFNAPLLATQYASLPHVLDVSLLDRAGGDGNDVCASVTGDTYNYIFDAGGGDCPAGAESTINIDVRLGSLS